ncbi:MAG TPA: class III lanthionine synthetase LanKC [Candidatus Dormibacteraeota bacterium]
MDERYSTFCLADPHFYDSPVRTRGDDVDFAIASRPVPPGWTRTDRDEWLVYEPPTGGLPPQGWKIHASASLDDAEQILTTIFVYCAEHGVPFKFVRSLQLLFLRNTKNMDRSASGKFVTIYPSGEHELETILMELGDQLAGKQGPYILSDLRWGHGPLYVRYGGFAERYCIGPAGTPVPAVADAEGSLVPDQRGPTFHVPPWVTLPACLEPHLAARNAVTVQEIPYRIEEAVQFSNGGGLYLGSIIDSGEQIVLKEARPLAGLVYDRADAVARLERERRTLERLAGLDEVPAIRGHFMLGDHHFLALEFIEGEPLQTLLAERYPATAIAIDPDTARDYAAWALDMCHRIEAAVDAVHRRGVVIGDLHPSNILVRPDGQPALVDFEVAAELAEGLRPTLADPAFGAPSDRQGIDVDAYALACLRLYMFLPLTRLLILERTRARELADEIAGVFPVPADFLDTAVRTIIGDQNEAPAAHPRARITAERDAWPDARAAIAKGIRASATLHRDDRLFPGDISQFDTPGGGLTVANGAAGVLYALAAAGAGRHADYEEWLVRRALRPPTGMPIGFYDGLHGVAHVLHRLGHRREAQEILSRCAQELEGSADRLGLDLVSGLAGIGLNLAWFSAATGDASSLKAAASIAGVIADRLGGEEDVAEISGGDDPYAGLTRGSSGPALLFLRLYEGRPDPALLDLAATALRQDLRRCRWQPYGGLEVDEDWRTEPYLADGSVGIGFVLDEYLARRDDEQFAAASVAIRRTAQSHFTLEPGLFHGLAGQILYLAGCTRELSPVTEPPRASLMAHVVRLNRYSIDYERNLAFPGSQLLRLSMDLATGGAGILLALAAALHETHPSLPFFEGPDSGPERQAELTTLHTKGGE